MKFVDNVRTSIRPNDERYEKLQQMAKVITRFLGESQDPLRKSIVAVLDYQDGDPEEYALLIAKMITLLPPEKVQ